MTWWQQLLHHPTTSQLLVLPVAVGGLAALAWVWTVDRVRAHRRWARLQRALADTHHHTTTTRPLVDWDKEGWT